MDLGFRQMAKAVIWQLTLVSLLWVLVNTYTFSLYTELMLQPTIFISVIITTYCSHYEKPGYKQIHQLFNAILAILMWIMIFYSITSFFRNYREAVNIVTLFPVLCFFLFYPFLYFFRLYMKYELLFMRIGHISPVNQQDKTCAKLQAVKHCWINLYKLNRFSTARCFYMESKDTVSAIIENFDESEKVESNLDIKFWITRSSGQKRYEKQVQHGTTTNLNKTQYKGN